MGTGAAVSRQLRQLPERMEGDSVLRRRTRQAEVRLEAMRRGAAGL